MSWESTVTYYSEINKGIRKKLGGLHSAKIVLHSVEFHEIEMLQHRGQWEKTAEILGEAAQNLEKAGCDFILICTNTMHKVADQIEEQINIPILHIADATAKKIMDEGINSVGLLGTKFTMEQQFYKGRLQENYGLKVLTPSEKDKNIVHDVIYNELCMGQIKESSRDEFVRIIHQLNTDGAEGVILGCTEIALLIDQSHVDIPLFDTTQIHSDAAVDMALS